MATSWSRRIPSIMKLSRKSSDRLQRWSRPIRSVLTDYMVVSKDVLIYAKTKPIRFGSVMTIGTLSLLLGQRNPDMKGFVNEVVQYSNEISQCSPLTRNPSAQSLIESHLLSLSTHTLRYINFGLFSIILRHSNYPDCSNFSQTCPQLMPGVLSIRERLVDIGVWNRWLILEREMTDFDVNPNESFDNS